MKNCTKLYGDVGFKYVALYLRRKISAQVAS